MADTTQQSPQASQQQTQQQAQQQAMQQAQQQAMQQQAAMQHAQQQAMHSQQVHNQQKGYPNTGPQAAGQGQPQGTQFSKPGTYPTTGSPYPNPHQQAGTPYPTTGTPYPATGNQFPPQQAAEPDARVLQAQIANLTNQLQIAQAIAQKERSRTEELNNLVNRMQADFDNYRKRTAETTKGLKTEGIIDVIERLIPVLDEIKQGIMLITDEKIAEGIKMIYRKINDMMGSFGVTEIPALGEMFDPNLHDAIMQVKVKDADKVGMVVEVFQKGYRMGDKIIRHSRVRVAR